MIRGDYGASILAQSAPANTNAADLYSPPADRRAIVSQIIIANTSSGSLAATVYAHASGNTKSNATAIVPAKSIPANSYEIVTFEDGLELNESGTIGIKSGSGNDLTFTLLGRELDA